MDDLSEMYLRFTFDLVARQVFDHLHWGLFRDIPEEPERLAEAQRCYADTLIGMLPDGVHRVMDVGCGLGGIARMLAEQKHQVVALSPRRDHCERLEAEQIAGLAVRCERFEDRPGQGDFDLLLFAESFNFFVDQSPQNARETIISFASRTTRHLRKNGYVLLADLISPEIHAELSSCDELTLIAEQDVHDEVIYTATLLQRLFDRHVVPYQRLLASVLEYEDPSLAKRVRETLAGVPNSSLREIFAGRMVEQEMAERSRYRMILLRAPGR